jgi:hypothetical protein
MASNGQRNLLAFVLALAVLALASIAIMGLAGATITGTAPPPSGDWVIDNATDVSDEVIVVTGNITVNATLTLERSTVTIVSPQPGAYAIVVTPAGELLATDSTLASGTPTKGFGFDVLGGMRMERCLVNGPEAGVRVMTDSTVTISSTTISNFRLGGLYLNNADGTSITDTTLVTSRFYYTMDLSRDVKATGTMTTYAVPDAAPVMIVGGDPSIDGLVASVNGTLSVTAMFEYYTTAYLNYAIHIMCPVVLVRSDDLARLDGVTVRDSVIDVNSLYNVDINVVPTSTNYIYQHHYMCAIILQNPRDIALDGISVSMVRVGYTTLSISVSGGAMNSGQITDGSYGVLALLDETFTDEEEHSSAVSLTHSTFLRASSLFMQLSCVGSDPDRTRVTIDIVVDSVEVREDSTTGAVRVENGMGWKTLMELRADIRVSNCTFVSNSNVGVSLTLTGGGVGITSATNVGGSTAPPMFLYDNLTIENCVFLTNYNVCLSITTQGGGGISSSADISKASGAGGKVDIFERILIRDNVFDDNDITTTTIRIAGNSAVHNGTERLVIDRNVISDSNSATGTAFMVTITEKDIIDITNSTFSNNIEGCLFQITTSGGDSATAVPAKIRISQNTFSGNKFTYSSGEAYPGDIVIKRLGGDMEVSTNKFVEDSSANLVNLQEIPASGINFAGYTKLNFHDNEITDSPNLLDAVYLYNFDAYHSKLTVNVDRNTLRDCGKAPLLDYYDQGSALELYDYDATINVRNNTVVNATGQVVRAHGNIEVLDNTFTSCRGYVLYLPFLYEHIPLIDGNTYTNCVDLIYMGAKAKALGGLAVTVEGYDLDCPGNALHFNNMVVTLNDCTLSGRTDPAVIAENSVVSIVGGSIEVGSGAIIGTGTITRYHSLEADVTWADASGTSQGVPAANVPMVLLNSKGGLAFVRSTDAQGHLGSLLVPAWTIRSVFVTVLTPHTMLIGTPGIAETMAVTLDRDLVGNDALDIVLKDDSLPIVRLSSPADGELDRTGTISVTGFVVELGSGIKELALTIREGAPIQLVVDSNGRFSAQVANLVDGDVRVRVTAKDVAGNVAFSEANVVIDTVAPALQVVEPVPGAITAASQVDLVVTSEPGSTVTFGGVVQVLVGDTATATWSLAEGDNDILVTSTDLAGNVATAIVSVRRDTIAPTLVVVTPEDAMLLSSDSVSVTGAVEPGVECYLLVMQGTDEVSNDTVTPASDGTFTMDVQLREGIVTLVLRARDAASNTREVRRTVTVDLTPPAMALTAPTDGTLMAIGIVHVTGTVDLGCQLYVNGVPVENDGTFDVTLTLNEGTNAIHVIAVDPAGNQRTESANVKVDTTPPVIAIGTPVLNGRLVTTSGEVQVSGQVLGEPTSLTIMGASVPVGTGGAFTTLVTLTSDGPVDIPIVAGDLAGNTATVTIDTLVDLSHPSLTADLSTDAGAGQSTNGTAVFSVVVGSGGQTLVVLSDGASGERVQTFTVPADGTYKLAIGLDEGVNAIVIRAIDAHGNVNETAPYTVTYSPVAEEGEEEEEGAGIMDAGIILLAIALALLITVVVVWLVRRHDGA